MPARTSESLVEGLCGAPDREHSARAPGPTHRVARGPLAWASYWLRFHSNL